MSPAYSQTSNNLEQGKVANTGGQLGRGLISLLPFFGLLLGISMWVIDAVVDVFFIHPHEEFLESLFASDFTEIWMRTLVIIVITAASIVMQYFMRKQYNFESKLLEQRGQLEVMVEERTRELQHLANFDALTDIYNRRKFQEELIGEMERTRRYNLQLTVMLLDIDFFKKVNDNFGHDEGDKVLIAISDILRKNLRGPDVYARWGGEEFIVFLPHTDTKEAERVAEKIRQLVNTIEYGDNKKISASFGISSLHTDEQISPLIKRSDEALYDAKNSGRDRVCVRE